jgi:hypothetical protein
MSPFYIFYNRKTQLWDPITLCTNVHMDDGSFEDDQKSAQQYVQYLTKLPLSLWWENNCLHFNRTCSEYVQTDHIQKWFVYLLHWFPTFDCHQIPRCSLRLWWHGIQFPKKKWATKDASPEKEIAQFCPLWDCHLFTLKEFNMLKQHYIVISQCLEW